MTKKSAARLMRDAAEVEAKRNSGKEVEKNNCWDDLNGIYEGAAALLARHRALAHLAGDTKLISFVKDKVSLIGLIKSLAGDLNSMSGELTEIHNQHVGKAGGGVDGDEVMNSITIYEQYHLFMERHEGVVMPTVYHITEIFEAAQRDMAAAQQVAKAAVDAVDPKVTTDVEFKEIPVDVPAVVDPTVVHVELDANDPNPSATVATVVADNQEQ